MQFDQLRRKFITLLGGATAAAWPLAVRAQQPSDRMRRVGVLMNIAEDDPQAQGRMAAFLQGLQPLGWIVGESTNRRTLGSGRCRPLS